MIDERTSVGGSEGDPRPPESAYARALPPYPFARLDALRREREARGGRVIDLGLGELREPVPASARAAAVRALGERSPYPGVPGLPALRQAAAGWVRRRFGVELDPERHVLPANGTKEAIFHLALAVVDPARRPLVMIPDPGYPVYALGARAAGAEPRRLRLDPASGHLPDLDAVPDADWDRTAILWLNYPHNPTGAVAPRTFLAHAAERARRHGFLLAADEAYADVYTGDPPPSALETGADHVLAFHSLSKRSAMAGYRAGFMAGDERVIGNLKRVRPGLGVATPDFVQAAAVAAWEDDEQPARIRARVRDRQRLAVRILGEAGHAVSAPPATFFLWLPVPSPEPSADFAERALEAGVVVLPGSALGPAGEGYVRISLTPEPAELEEALVRLAALSV